MKENVLPRCFPKLHQTLSSCWNYDASVAEKCVIFNMFLGLACDQNDLDSNEYNYAHTKSF